MDMKNIKLDREKLKEEEEFRHYLMEKNLRRNVKLNKSYDYLNPKYYNIIKINPFKENKMELEDKYKIEEIKRNENEIENDDNKCENMKIEDLNNGNINIVNKEDQYVEEKKNEEIKININRIDNIDNKCDKMIEDNLYNECDIFNNENNDHDQDKQKMCEEIKNNNNTDINLDKNWDNMHEDNMNNDGDNLNKENNVQGDENQHTNYENDLSENTQNLKSDNNKLSDIISDKSDKKIVSEKFKEINLKIDKYVDNKTNSNDEIQLVSKEEKLSEIILNEEIISKENNSIIDIHSKPVASEKNNKDSNRINLDNMKENPKEINKENHFNKQNNNTIPIVKKEKKIPFVNKKYNKYYLFLKQFKKVKFNIKNNSNNLNKSMYKYIKDNLNEIKEIRKYLKINKIDERKVIDLKIQCNNNIFTPVTIDNYISDLYLDNISYIFKYDLINGIDNSKVNIYWGNYKYFIFVRYGNYTDVITDKSDLILSKDLLFVLIKGIYEYYTSIVYKINENNYISYFCIKFGSNFQINTCHFDKWLKLENNKEKFYHIRSGNYGNCQLEYNHTKYNTRLDNKLKEEDEELLQLYKNTNKFGIY